jgi:hypothetical protein
MERSSMGGIGGHISRVREYTLLFQLDSWEDFFGELVAFT